MKLKEDDPTNKMMNEDENPNSSQPVNSSKKSERQQKRYTKDLETVYKIAKEKDVDLDNMGDMPLMDSQKGVVKDAVKRAYPKDLHAGIEAVAASQTAPQNEAREKLDKKALMESVKKERRMKIADALDALGSELQGKSYNTENFESKKIERKRDQQFQEYKDVTERNKKTKYLYEEKSRKEMFDWADQESKNMREDQNYRDKMKMLSDKYADDAAYKAEQLKLAKERNRIAASKGGKQDKEDKPVKIQTAQKTYELKPEEAEFYKGEILKNAGTLRSKYPGWFTETQKTDPLTGSPVGGVSYKLNPEVKDTDMIRAYLENKEPGHLNEDAYEANKAANFDKYRKEKGLSTAPASQPAKSQTQKKSYSTGGLY